MAEVSPAGPPPMIRQSRISSIALEALTGRDVPSLRCASAPYRVASPAPAERRFPVELAGGHYLVPQVRALLVNRGDHRPHRHADVDQHRLGQLQRRLK